MTYYICYDKKGKIIARCQTIQDIENLKKMGRPIADIKGNERRRIRCLLFDRKSFRLQHGLLKNLQMISTIRLNICETTISCLHLN